MDELKNLTEDDADGGTGVIKFDAATLDALEKDWGMAASGKEKQGDRDDADQRDSEDQPGTQKRRDAENTRKGNKADDDADKSKTDRDMPDIVKASADEVNDKDRQAADQSFTLKHLDEVKTVGRDEVIVLAQKGLDYDRIRAKYNEAEAARNLKEAAPEKTPEQLGAEKRQADIREFLAEYGTALDPQTIPPEVWSTVAKGKTLLSAYQSWENKQLKEENGTLKKNNENKARSTGSRDTAGSGKPRDAIEDDWYKKE